MPTRTIGEFSKKAIEHGLDPLTPAVAVARATRPDEAMIGATIADLPARIADAQPGGPLLVMIGRALADAAGARRDAGELLANIRAARNL